jgi:hypothetical protein
LRWIFTLLTMGTGLGAPIALRTKSLVSPLELPPLKRVRGASRMTSEDASPMWAVPLR